MVEKKPGERGREKFTCVEVLKAKKDGLAMAFGVKNVGAFFYFPFCF